MGILEPISQVHSGNSLTIQYEHTCSSNSFMHNWLGNFVGNDRFNTYLIGHLSKTDGRRFWNKRIKWILRFEDAYSISGGNLFLDFSFGGIHPNDSFFLQQAKNHLTIALDSNNPFIWDPLKSAPIQTRELVIMVMRKTTSSEGSYVYYTEMCKEIGQAKLESMIEYNVLHPLLSCGDLNLTPVTM